MGLFPSDSAASLAMKGLKCDIEDRAIIQLCPRPPRVLNRILPKHTCAGGRKPTGLFHCQADNSLNIIYDYSLALPAQ